MSKRIPYSTEKVCKHVILLQQKRIFLNRCLKKNILLPSKQHKGIDHDILLIHQARRLKSSIQVIDEKIVDSKKIWQNIAHHTKQKLKRI